MANLSENSLLTGLLTPTSQRNQKADPKRKRIRRCRSAPLAEFVPGELNGKNEATTLPRSESLLDKLHPSFKRVAIYLTFYLVIGTICFSNVMDQIKGERTNVVLDAVYFCIVTMTTVGYGDLVPNSCRHKTASLHFCVLRDGANWCNS
ncbi:Two-pore potassium channel 1 [Abeliophyllum distichum]|uniref:Two-pore potassium channel 1 n=1 Tax=Abeliophyllum distichum TaxID=126358 RepID=A0ABD1PSK0_9LAMI